MDFSDVSKADLIALAEALDSKLRPPYSELALKRIVTATKASLVAERLRQLDAEGFDPRHISTLLQSLVAERINRPTISDVIDLVTTGPETSEVANRDTAVVVRNLFANARHSVMVAGYSVYQGQKVFEALANRMKELDTLEVTMYLNLPNEKDISQESLLVRRFVERFKSTQWPKDCRLPTVYYDPRSVDPDPRNRASLHAKCVVVDGHEVFISSANFTDRAQHLNIEVGIRITSTQIAEQLTNHFQSLQSANVLRRAL